MSQKVVYTMARSSVSDVRESSFLRRLAALLDALPRGVDALSATLGAQSEVQTLALRATDVETATRARRPRARRKAHAVL